MTRRPPYVLTALAKQDMRNISRYTYRTWGASQRDTYLRALVKKFTWLADNPEIGRLRPDVGPDCRCFPEGSHIICYRVMGKTIEILAIPHQAMDIENYFLG